MDRRPRTPSAPTSAAVTELLDRWRGGDETAGEAALEYVYGDLHRLATSLLRRERPDHTLQPTALVHEAYLRLAGGREPDLSSRGHLIGILARLMRQVLVNHARDRRALRRGGDRRRVPLEPALALFEARSGDLVALDEALTRLAALDPRPARIVELRFFAGLDAEEIAELLGVSSRTVERDWAIARAWLRQELETS